MAFFRKKNQENLQNNTDKKKKKNQLGVIKKFLTKRKEKKFKTVDDGMSLVKYKSSLAFQIPYEMLIDENTLSLKYGGFSRVLKIKNFDTDYLDETKRNFIFSKFNNMLKSMPQNTYFHYELIRKQSSIKKPIERPYAPLTTRLCEKIRYEDFENTIFFQNDIYLTFSFVIPVDGVRAIQDYILNENKIFNKKTKKGTEEDSKASFEKYRTYIKEFEDKFHLFLGMLENAVLDYKILSGSELITYLSYSLNPLEEVKTMDRMPAPIGFPLDTYIPFSNIVDTDYLKVGDYYTKVISEQFLPNSVIENCFKRIASLDFELRMVSRFIPYTKDEAVGMVSSSQNFHSGKRYNPLQYLLMATDKKNAGNMKEDEYEAGLTEEARLILQEVRNDKIGFGLMTQSIIVQDKDLIKLEEKAQKILKEFTAVSFKAVDDKYNTLDAYMGAVPTNLVSNVRKRPIHTVAFSYLIPTSNSWNGSPYTPHRQDESLLKCLNKAGEVFNFENLYRDVGHTIIVGKTGNGKSVLLNTIANYYLKYKNAQVFFFDIDASSKILCKANEGIFYNIGGEKNHIQFQPLRRIDTDNEKIWALEFIKLLISQEDKTLLNPKANEKLWEAMKSLGERPIEYRTITEYVALLQDEDLKLALKAYTSSGAYGVYFDGNDENIADARFITFEMRKIIDIEKVVKPVAMYLMHIIDTLKINKGYPTAVLVDEARFFFKNNSFKTIFEEQLLTARKKNTSYFFAVQLGSHILDSELRDTILDQCFTKIVLPNSEITDAWLELYNAFNINNAEIEAIKKATPKLEYFVKSPLGSTVFNLKANQIDLAYVGVADIKHQNSFDEICSNISSTKHRNITWLKHLNKLNKISDFNLEKALKIIEEIYKEKENKNYENQTA